MYFIKVVIAPAAQIYKELICHASSQNTYTSRINFSMKTDELSIARPALKHWSKRLRQARQSVGRQPTKQIQPVSRIQRHLAVQNVS